MPTGSEKLLGLDPELQVAGQVFLMEREISELIAQYNLQGRLFECSYEQFCRAPNDALADLMVNYEQTTGHKVSKVSVLPDRFDISKPRFDDKVRNRIADFFATAESRFYKPKDRKVTI